MANIGVSAIKLIDSDGDPLDDGSGKLNVNATLVAGATIDIGDVDMFLDGGTAVLGGAGAVAAGVLRTTLASDDPAVALLGTIDTDMGSLLALNTAILINTNTIAGDTTEIASYIWTPGIEFQAQQGFFNLAVRDDVLNSIGSVSVADGDISHIKSNQYGALYVDGAELENEGVQGNPSLIGGRYDSSARTLGNGDAGAVALNASGHVLIDVVNGGQLDTIIDTLETTLTAIETDQAAIEVLLTAANVDHAANEALLITIDEDTDAIKTDIAALEVLSTAANVDLAAMEVLLTGMDSDTNAIKTGINSLANAVYIDDDNWTNDSSRHMLVGGLYQSSMQSVTDGDVAPFQVDANGVLRTSPSHSITGGADGVKVVTTAGTDVVLGGDVDCKKIDIQAQTDNTGLIAVGFTGVDATEATGTGVILYAGDTYSLEITNLNLIYIDSTEDGEGVRYTYFT